MFEITYGDSEILENYLNERMAYKGAIYDFTFEDRYLIYHAPLRNKIDYIAIDLESGLSSNVLTEHPDNIYPREAYLQ